MQMEKKQHQELEISTNMDYQSAVFISSKPNQKNYCTLCEKMKIIDHLFVLIQIVTKNIQFKADYKFIIELILEINLLFVKNVEKLLMKKEI